MANQLSDEEEEDAQPERPDYLSDPTALHYLDRLRDLILDLDSEIGHEQPYGPHELRGILMVIHDQIAYKGNLYELDSMFRIHFASFYSAPDADCKDALTYHPMTTSN